jgi:hypothetical protein
LDGSQQNRQSAEREGDDDVEGVKLRETGEGKNSGSE